jgi:PAS domain S-box-containing protein
VEKWEHKKRARPPSVERLRQAFRQSEAYKRALLDSALDCVICTDSQGKIVEFNAAAERIFHLSRSAVLGRDLADTVLPRSLRDIHRREFFHSYSCAKTEMIGNRLESKATRFDGVEFPAEFTVSKVSVGRETMFTVTIRDITARVRAEEAVTRLAAIVESSQDAIYGGDVDGRIQTWNKGAELMYGYTADEVLGESVSILTPSGRRDELTRITERIREGLETRNIETVRLAKGGRLIDVSLTVSPILDSAGAVIGASAIARDITARKAAEEALRKATQTSVYASPVPIVALSPNGSVTLWNPAAEQVFGWSEPEVLGKPNPTIPEDCADETQLTYRRLLGGETIRGVELQRRKRDGSLLTISLSAAPLWSETGTVKGIIKFLTDITEHKRIEHALRATEEKYRSIFENSIEGIYQVAPDGHYLSANPALARMLGFDSPHELVQARNGVANHGYVSADLRAEFMRLLEEQGMVQNFESQVYRKDGKLIWVRVNARVIRDAGGNITHFEGTVEDVTEQRELEQQFRQMQKIEAIGRLAGGVAHDFNNILMAVSSFAELLGTRFSPEDRQRSYVDEIIKATDRGSSLTQKLLAFSRRQVFLPKVVNLNRLVHDQIDMLRRLLAENIDVKLIQHPEAGMVRVDASQIEQVVMNLVINARDAMPDGGELVIETTNLEPDSLQVGSQMQAEGRWVVLSVRDSGCGMDVETQSHIFEPFFTTKEQGKGTGLGLATVFGIVKQNGGHITVHSELGAGSTFKVHLPRVDGAAEALRSERDGVVSRGTETILLVEDEEAVRSSATTYLREMGYSVLVAAEGREAVLLAEQYQGSIHVLLTDLVLPRMSGPELAERIILVRPDTRVVFMSGYFNELFAGRRNLDPRYAFLQKPFRLTALTRCIRDVLDRKVAAGAAG